MTVGLLPQRTLAAYRLGNVDQDGRARGELLQASWYEIDSSLSCITAQNC